MNHLVFKKTLILGFLIHYLMKIKSLILALAVLSLASCTNTDSSDPASNADASPLLAKQVVGVNMLSADSKYDEPCTILGEEYVRHAFNLTEETKLEEVAEHDGCAFEWAGNKVLVSFGSEKPYESIFVAENDFDKMYLGKSTKATAPVAEAPADTTKKEPVTAGTATEEVAANGTDKSPATEVHAPAHHTESAAGKGSFESVSGIGDKAVWNSATGAMHVLYANHIINVTVESKGKPEARKEQAQSLVDVLIEKIANNEYVRKL